MTQDQPGQAQGTGYVVRGEVVPDDETDGLQAEQSGPMTRLRKVASALRGDTPDQTIPDQRPRRARIRRTRTGPGRHAPASRAR